MNKPIDCFKCKHFHITWEKHHPRACRAYGFKTERLPSVVVFENSGKPCYKFSPKEPKKTNKKSNDWIA